MAVRATTPLTNTTPQTGKGWYQGASRYAITRRVQCFDGAQQAALNYNLPAFAKIISVHLANVTAATVTGSAGAAADGIVLAMFPTSAATVAVSNVLTAPPTTSIISATAVTNGATSGTILASIGTGTSESNGVYRGDILPNRVFNATTPRAEGVNIRQTPAFLALLPGVVASGIFAFNSTAATSGAFFGTGTVAASTVVAATVDVVLYVEAWDDYPSMP